MLELRGKRRWLACWLTSTLVVEFLGRSANAKATRGDVTAENTSWDAVATRFARVPDLLGRRNRRRSYVIDVQGRLNLSTVKKLLIILKNSFPCMPQVWLS